MAVLDHNHHHRHGESREDLHRERMACVRFGLFWLGFFALVAVVNMLSAAIF